MTRFKFPAFLLVLFLSSSVEAGSMSSIRTAEWSYKSFCENTALSYAEAYSAGEKGLILKALAKSPTYQALDVFQRAAFVRLVEDLSKSYKHSDDSDSEFVMSCEKKLRGGLESVDRNVVDVCDGLYWTAIDIIDRPELFKSIDNGLIAKLRDQAGTLNEEGKEIWPEMVYYECLRQGADPRAE